MLEKKHRKKKKIVYLTLRDIFKTKDYETLGIHMCAIAMQLCAGWDVCDGTAASRMFG